jgi:hypothetical protein
MNRLTDVFEGPAASGVLLGHYYDALSERTGIAYGGTTAGGRSPPPRQASPRPAISPSSATASTAPS